MRHVEVPCSQFVGRIERGVEQGKERKQELLKYIFDAHFKQGAEALATEEFLLTKVFSSDQDIIINNKIKPNEI